MKEKIKTLPVFWKNFIVCAVVTLTMTLAVVVCANIMQRSLEKEKLAEILLRLESDVRQTADTLGKVSAIPGAVEGSKYYDMIHLERSGALDLKYVSVLVYLKGTMIQQLYLRGDSLECLVYFPGLNSFCSSEIIIFEADDWLKLRFGEEAHADLLEQLRTKGTVRLQALEGVNKNGASYDCVALTAYPRDCSTAVLQIYTQEQFLKMLGLPMLPEGSVLTVIGRDGEVVLRYPEEGPQKGTRCHETEYPMEGLPVTVKARIPLNELGEVARDFRRSSLFMLFGCLLAGTLVSILLSKGNALPIQKLAAQFTGEKKVRTNEVDLIAKVLESQVRESGRMKDSLLQAVAARAFSGGVLSQQDIHFLEQVLPSSVPCRAVIIYAPSDIGDAAALFREPREGVLLSSVFSRNKCGLIMKDREGFRSDAEVLMEEMLRAEDRTEEAPARLRCGISGVFSAPQALERAVHEAAAAIPQEARIGFYSEGGAKQDQLQESIDELSRALVYRGTRAPLERFEALLGCVNAGNGQTAFYNTQYVIGRVIREQNFPMEILPAEYDARLTAYDNMLRLREAVKRFTVLPEGEDTDTEQENAARFQDYAEAGYADATLSAASAAEAFGCSVRYVNNCCRASFGMNFNDVLSGIRMKKAAELLVESEEGIQEIADRCGCPVASTFFRLFKKEWGITPAQYREFKAMERQEK